MKNTPPSDQPVQRITTGRRLLRFFFGLAFILLVLIAIVVACPLAWYFSQQWLQQFAYHNPIGWSVFLTAGGMAIAIAFLTISYQSIKAALANPVKSLRNE